MTSNLGSEYILNDKEHAESSVMSELRHTFKPEFINRIDEIIIFNSLSKEVVYEVLDKIIADLELRLKDKRLKISLTDKAKDFVINESYDENYGARPIKRYVQRNIETLLANYIIQDKIKFNSNVLIDVDDNKFVIK